MNDWGSIGCGLLLISISDAQNLIISINYIYILIKNSDEGRCLNVGYECLALDEKADNCGRKTGAQHNRRSLATLII